MHMKILIVSGFLGAGKTTFIKELMARTGKPFVVLENEYGSTDVDEQVLSAEDNANVWDLTEGCVCCTKSADLNASVVTIESTLEPEYLIVEPSGVGALSNVIRNLRRIEYERITLLRPITVIDGSAFQHDRRAFADIYEDQMRAAGVVVVSKPDHADGTLYQQVEDAVHEVNPQAEVLHRHYREMPPEWWDGLLATACDGRVLAQMDEAQVELETFTVEGARVPSPATLLCILQRALLGEYGQVVRAKGILPAGVGQVRFDVAGGTAAITGFEPAGEAGGAGADGGHGHGHSEAVFIGRALDRIALMRDLDAPGRAPHGR